MSRTLAVELDEKVFAVIAAKAAAEGATPDRIAGEYLAWRFAPAPSGGEKRGDIRRLFGSVRVDDPKGIDNEQIDADLAAEYGRGLGGSDE